MLSGDGLCLRCTHFDILRHFQFSPYWNREMPRYCVLIGTYKQIFSKQIFCKDIFKDLLNHIQMAQKLDFSFACKLECQVGTCALKYSRNFLNQVDFIEYISNMNAGKMSSI